MSSTEDRVGQSTPVVTARSGRPRPPTEAICRIRLLGPIELGTDATAADLGAPKQRALLLALVLNANETVPTDRLIELLWGELAPRTAAHSIQIYVSELRKLLAAMNGAPTVLTRSPGYRLEVEPDDVDLLRFERLLRDGSGALRTGATAEGAAILRAALGLWRGMALADFAYEDFAQDPARRWQGLRLDALEHLASAELELGHVDEALRWAEMIIAEDPLRDRGQELVMVALYRAGRHVDALRAYERHREHLSDELGVVPSPPLRQLHERILLHDATLLPEPPVATPIDMIVRNPYKGLRAFREEDSGDFFGRDALVAQVATALHDGARLIALVGPSGAGKSSVVAAGVLPAVRVAAADAGADRMIRSLVPGPHPLDEVTAAIWSGEDSSGAWPPGQDRIGQQRSGPCHPGWLRRAGAGARSVRGAVPHRRRGSKGRASGRAHCDPQRTGQPRDDLAHAASGLLRPAVVVRHVRRSVHPWGGARPPDDASRARGSNRRTRPPGWARGGTRAGGRARRRRYRPARISSVAAIRPDRAMRPGDRGQSHRRRLPRPGWSARDPHQAGRGDVNALDAGEQQVAMQVLLRMVRLGQGTGDARRRVPVAELTDLDIDSVVLSGVLQRLARRRLLSFNRDPVSGAPSVEVAHEALLTEWKRLAGWIERHRTGLRRLESLRTAAQEWEDSGRNADYLLTGSRLAEFDEWARDSALAIGTGERDFVRAGLAQQREQAERAQAEADAQRRSARTSRRRLAVTSAIVVVLVVAVVLAVLAGRGGGPLTVTLVYHGDGEVSELIEAGFVQATSEFGLVGSQVVVEVPADAEVNEISDSGEDVVIIAALETDVETIARAHPGTRYIALDVSVTGDNVASLQFDFTRGLIPRGRGGGSAEHNGHHRVRRRRRHGHHLALPGRVRGRRSSRRPIHRDPGPLPVRASVLRRGLPRSERWRASRAELFDGGADVVFAAAGTSGLGVFEAAVEMSAASGTQLWAIGVDSDQYATVGDLPGSVGAAEWQDHILTSVVKRYDTAVYDAVAAAARGEFEPGVHRLGLAEHGVDIAYSGGYLEDLRPELEALRTGILAGDIDVPCRLASREQVDLACDA